MENYIVINGKKAELTEEQLKALGIEIKKDDPFEFELGDYYYINPCGDVVTLDFNTQGCLGSAFRYKVANYCKDSRLLEQRALHETLNRLLWRYSMQHDGDKIDWGPNNRDNKYKIFYDYAYDTCDVDLNWTSKNEGAVYFYTESIANAAIDEIIVPFMNEHPEFKF